MTFTVSVRLNRNTKCNVQPKSYHKRLGNKFTDESFYTWFIGCQVYASFSFSLQEEQVMYPSSLENERFMVAIVNCKRQGSGPGDALMLETEGTSWEITRALKCD